MHGRSVHLVGSIPADTATEAMVTALHRTGGQVATLPDGETGERDNWVVVMSERLRSHPALATRTGGHWLKALNDVPSHQLKNRRQFTPESLRYAIGLHDAFQETYPQFTRIRTQYGREDLLFQLGLPSHLDLSAITLGPTGVRLRDTFRRALAAEVEQIHRDAGNDVVFQIEFPVPLILLTSTPGVLRPKAAGYLARQLMSLVREFPVGTRVGLHLCLGDYGNRAATSMRDATPIMLLVNALTGGWPPGRELEFVHVPLAAGGIPAPMEPEFYRPLRRLRLPESTRLAAGLVHELAHTDDMRQQLRTVEQTVDRRVDVAAACGLGRRTPGVARDMMRIAAELCDEP